MSEETPNSPTETTTAAVATSSTEESSGAPIVTTTEASPNAIITASSAKDSATVQPVIPAAPPLTKEHKETLLSRIEDLPEEFIAWVKKHL